jgi:superfamily II DNA or RNA helicase
MALSATIRKGAQFIEVSEDGQNPLPVVALKVLEGRLQYEHMSFQFNGGNRFDDAGSRHGMTKERRHMFTYDEKGRFCCLKGFYPKVTGLLEGLGYRVVYIDKDPPKDPAIYTANWDRVFDRFQMRPQQDTCLAQIDMHDHGVIVAPPAFGKTHLMAMVANLYPRAKIDIVTKRKDVVGRILQLITETIPEVGQVGGGKHRKGRVTVYTADSLHRSDYDADILLADECFPAGTAVNGKPIERINIGDLVQSVDAAGRMVLRPVIRRFVNKVTTLVRIVFGNGATLVCTPNHPIWTSQGYRPAISLQIGTQVLYADRWISQEHGGDLLRMWQGRNDYGQSTALSSSAWAFLLQPHLRGAQDCSCSTYTSGRCGNVATHAFMQSYTIASGTCCNKQAIAREALSNKAWGQWHWTNALRAAAINGAGLANESHRKDLSTAPEWISSALQDRRGQCHDENSYRDRRAEPLSVGAAGTGPQETGAPYVVGVASVTILEPTSLGYASDVCPDGQVYNLEVADTHNYFANGVLVHNCHELVTDRLAELLARYERSRNFGFTATPDSRLDGAHARMEGLFGPKIFEMSQQVAEACELVVPVIVQWLDARSDYDPARPYKTIVARKRNGIWRNSERNTIIANAAKSFLQDNLQVLILVDTIDHALHIRKFLPEASLCYSEGALAVGSEKRDFYVRNKLLAEDEAEMTAMARTELRRKFERREVMCTIATGVWAVGVSFDSLNVLIRADGGDSETLNIQMPGRVCRTDAATHKESGLLVDLNDGWSPYFRARSTNRRRDYHTRGWTQLNPDGTIWQPITRSPRGNLRR